MGKKKIKSLGDLKKVKVGKQEDDLLARILAEKDKPKKEIIPDEPEPEVDEDELFASAMLGVEAMDGNSGRQVAPKPKKKKPVKQEPKDQELAKFMRGDIEFDLEYSEEYMRGFVRGLDSQIYNKLKAGSYSIAGHIDLHGLNAQQAYDNLLFFVRESYYQSHKCLLIVTGRGKNSPGGHSVLKREIESWLTKDPLRRVVLAFCTAQPKDGGAGALYVLLRNQKKTQGKVKWDTMLNWTEDI